MAINSFFVIFSRGGKHLRIASLPRLISILITASVIAGLGWTFLPALPAHAAGSITVDRTDDPAVTVAGSGAATCSAASNDCSLRGATLVANANPGTTIDIPAGTYKLSIDGSSEFGSCSDATVGDLDIGGNSGDDTIITGAGAATTIIQQSTPHDRVICVDQSLAGDFTFSISGVTITGGREPYGVGGGGMISGGATGDVTNVTNVTFSNNQANDTLGAGSPVGGGLGNGDGALNVSGSTFGGSLAPCSDQSNINCANESTGSGGGVYYSNNNDANSQTLTVSNSTFENNVSTSGNGGGLITTQATSPYSVTRSTFTNNQAGSTAGGGGGIYNESGSLSADNNTFTGNQATGASASGNAFGSPDGGGANITANYNRIVNNSGSTTDVHAGSGSTNAITNNWWGCNGGPGATGCDTVGGSGTNNYNPWIVLKTTASPSAINYADSTTLTASFLQNSSGGTLTAGQVSTMIGQPVSWTNAAHGTLSNQQITIQSTGAATGTATATFTAGSTSADCGNVAKGEATVDSIQSGDATATASITINCPDLQVSKTNDVSGSVQLGNGWTWTLTGTNAGPGQARFTNGQTILTDNLPNSNISYGAVTENNISGVTGTISCSINGTDDLSCTANGSVTINSSGSFTASFVATPTAVGFYSNPRTTCAVDPNNFVPETSDANNTCSNSVNVVAPDLTVVKSNNVSGATTIGNSWTWKLHVANSAANATASFASGQTVLTDDLPNANIAYGTPAAGNGTNITNIGNISCGITSNTLTCTATGPVTIGTSGSFDVTFDATPSAVATFTNPRSAGSCSVDPTNNVTESNEADNVCNSDSVIVSKADTITTITSHLPNPSFVGQPVIIDFTVAPASGPGTPTGNVTVSDGVGDTCSATIVAGSCMLTPTSAGSPLTLTATYGSDALYNGSTSLGVSQTVIKADTTTSITSESPDPSLAGDPVTVDFSVAANDPGAGIPTGNVTISDGVDSCVGTVAAGSCNISLTTPGIRTLTAIYAGDANFNTSTSTGVSHTVNDAPAITSVNWAIFTVVTPGSFTITTSGIPGVTSIVEFGALPSGLIFTDNHDGTASLSGTPAIGTGKAYPISFTASNGISPDATQSFTLSVDEPAAFTSANHTTFGINIPGTFTVTTSGFPVPGLISATSVPTLPLSVNLVNKGDGTATLSGTPAPADAGNYTLTITASNGLIPAGQQTFTLTILQASSTTTLTSSANPSVFGQSVTFTATVSSAVGTPTGTADFYDGTTLLGSGTLDVSGEATFTTSSLTIANSPHAITTVYLGDTGFTGSTSDAVSQVVNKASTSTSVIPSANPSVFGQSVTFTATVAATPPGAGTPTGTVEFFDGVTDLGSGTLDGSGQAAFSISSLSVSSHGITANYAGDSNFETSTSSGITQVVNKASTSTGVISLLNPSVFGQSVTFTATVAAVAPGAGTPTGTVDFLDGLTLLGTGTLDGSDQADFTISDLSVGASPHSISASYNGDADFAASGSAPVLQVVNQAATITTLTSSADPSVFGQPMTFTVTVAAVAPGTGTPTGTVVFMDGLTVLGTSTLDGSGQATFTISDLSVGASPHSLTATYYGDTNFSASTSAVLSQTIYQASTTTTLLSSANPSVLGQPVTFTATVAAVAPGAGTPTGTVEFFDGVTSLGSSTLDVSGQATLTIATLSVSGSPHSITAHYGGDINFMTSAADTLSQVVNQGDTSTALISSLNPSLFGDSVTFTATVSVTAPASGTPTGTVQFFDGGTSLGTGTLDVSGQASFTISTLAASASAHSITAVYSADANFSASTSAPLLQVVDLPATITSANSITFTTGVANLFTVTTSGIPAPTISQTGDSLPASLTFSDNLNGTASLAGNPLTADVGTYHLVFTAHNGAGVDATQSFTLTVDNTPGVVTINSLADTGDGQIVENENTNVAITKLLVVFSNSMNSSEAQTNTNYSLLLNGTTSISINTVTYDDPTKTATLNINGGLSLPNGAYKLTVKASLHDAAGIALPADFVRNFVVDTNSPVITAKGVVGTPGNSIILNNASFSDHFTSLTVRFNKDVQNPADDTLPHAVTNPENYLLIQKGPNGKYDTQKCSDVVAGNPLADDIKIPTGPVTYDNNGGAGPFIATVILNNSTPLPLGEYRLFICGTTSITDIAGNKLNGGLDSAMTFTIRNPASAPAPSSLPATGFAPNRATSLSSQPDEKAYSDMGDFWLEIPRLGVRMNIVGVPENGNSWDVSWLGNQAGWLNGTAYPTTAGNSVLTGHVYDSLGQPGPFVHLNGLWYGDQIIVHAGSVQYVYEVREVLQVAPDAVSPVFKHEDLPWVTLITCRGYDNASNSYKYRVVVRAVLVSVK